MSAVKNNNVNNRNENDKNNDYENDDFNNNEDDTDDSLPDYTTDFPACLSTYPKNFPTPPYYFNFFFLPGVYGIINTKNNKIYFGESMHVGNRLCEHFIQLKNNRGEVPSLQEDWNLYEANAFDFVILKIGENPWSDRVFRLAVERQYIQKHKNVYNTVNVTIQEYRVPSNRQPTACNAVVCDVKDKNEKKIHLEFVSVYEAGLYFNVNPDLIRAAVANKTNNHWQYKELVRTSSPKARPVVCGNDYYPSVNMGASAIGVNEYTIRYYISKGRHGWKYFDQMTDEQKALIPNLQEQIASQNKINVSTKRGVKHTYEHDGKTYVETFTSTTEAAKAAGVHQTTIMKRCNQSAKKDDPNFKGKIGNYANKFQYSNSKWEWIDKIDK